MLAEMMICWLMFTVMISAKAAGSMISRKYELQTTYHSGGSETFGRRKGERLPNDCMRALNDAAILRPTRLGALEFEKRKRAADPWESKPVPWEVGHREEKSAVRVVLRCGRTLQGLPSSLRRYLLGLGRLGRDV
jgi:hypothetical protein